MSKRIEEDRERMREEREKRSKPLYDLVHEETFIVQAVRAYSHSTSVSEIGAIGGPPAPSHETGYTQQIKLDVLSIEPSTIPVRKLTFDGLTTVRSGEKILALIPRLDSESERDTSVLYERENHWHFDRAYKSEERAIRITILQPDGNIAREEHAVDFHHYQRPNYNSQGH
ncbi:MAG TPA: hypothetical protein VJK51_00865 [Candidatus Nanoarchaeia archaeon]|nr:hypothetical protein [Candidatus Nanoarchaeia archaeon]